jgi:hypothetical protein
MATDNSPIPADGGAAATGAPKFFQLGADYLIDPGSPTEELGNDIGCLHEALEEVIHSIIEADSRQQAEMRARQVRGVAREYVRRAHRATQSAGGVQ